MTGADAGAAGPWRRWLPWGLLAIAVIAAVLVAVQRQGRIDDLESRNRALEARAAAPGGTGHALRRVAARAAIAEQDARDTIRPVQLQQGRIEALNRHLAARQIEGAVRAGRQVARCQIAAVRASTAASSVANALNALAVVAAGQGAAGGGSSGVRITATDSAFGQAQRSWVGAAAALDICAG